MRKKTIWIFTSILLILALVTGSGNAFYKGNVDGVWGEIDQLQYLDIIGQIGFDPGEGFGWGDGTINTYRRTMRRNPNICTGDIIGSDPFSPVGLGTGWSEGDLSGLGAHAATCNGNDLIISEYVHMITGGNNHRRAIEIYNATNFPVDLAGYKLQIFYNGSLTAGTTIDLAINAVLGIHDVWVVADSYISGQIETEDQITNNLNFTGNDVVALVRGGSGYEGAECDNWATGPNGSNPDDTTNISWQQSYWNQTGTNPVRNTDWKQVRYGRPQGYTYNCPQSTNGFRLQSGFGFDGTDGPDPVNYHENEPFVMGVFCHYNNPISAPNAEGSLHSVPLTVTVSGIRCDNNTIPDEGEDIAFTYQFRLDETPNSGQVENCRYTSTTVCADAVFISQPPADQVFTCHYDTQTVNYTIITLGFMDRVDGACPEWNPASAKREFVSQEGNTNCGCMYGMIADEVPTAVELLYFSAIALESTVKLEWATAAEIDNYGFNLYRAESQDGERLQLNESLIPSLVAPGTPYGSEYSFIDESAVPGVLYYYWLEDVDLNLRTGLHGPVEAIIE